MFHYVYIKIYYDFSESNLQLSNIPPYIPFDSNSDARVNKKFSDSNLGGK